MRPHPEIGALALLVAATGAQAQFTAPSRGRTTGNQGTHGDSDGGGHGEHRGGSHAGIG